MKISNRIRGLRSALLITSVFVELALTELFFVILSVDSLTTTLLYLISLGCVAIFVGVYFGMQQTTRRKLRLHLITEDDYHAIIKIPTFFFFVGLASFAFFQAQLLPISQINEMLFHNTTAQASLEHFVSLSSVFAYQVDTYRYQYLESSVWVFNCDLFASLLSVIIVTVRLIRAVRQSNQEEVVSLKK